MTPALLLACTSILMGQPAPYPCAPASEPIACRCSEWFAFDQPDPNVVRVEVRRGIPNTETWTLVGTLHQTPAFDDEDGHHPAWISTLWFPWRDSNFPPDMVTEYRFRGCDAAGLCSDWGEGTLYRPPPAANMRCYDRTGKRETCR